MDTRALAQLALAGLVAGGFALAGCEKDASPTAPKDGNQANAAAKLSIDSAKTEDQFDSACARLGGTVTRQGCENTNDCRGHVFQGGQSIKHDCKGQTSCAGLNCKEP